MKLGSILNAAQYEIRNAVSHNANADIVTPKEGQWYYNTVTKRIRYWSSSTGTGAGWIEVNPSGIQSISLNGDVSGTYVGGNIQTIATADLIETKNLSFNPDSNSHVLYYNVATDELEKFGFDDLRDWIQGFVPTGYNLTTDSFLGDTRVILTTGLTISPVRFAGTANEIEIIKDPVIQDRLIFGLPNNITVTGINVTNLTINGVPYTPYVHPTQTAINIDGTGLQFVQDINVNTSGHTTSVVLGTVPSASTTSVGVMRFATDPEVISGTAGVAVQASQLGSLLGGWGFKNILTGASSGGSFPVVHNLGTLDVQVELYDQATGDTIYGDVQRSNLNTVVVTLGAGGPNNIVALIRRVV